LIKNGVDVNTLDRWGGRPLNYVQRDSEVEKMLIKAGATRGDEQVGI
jgi:hypothetical protein